MTHPTMLLSKDAHLRCLSANTAQSPYKKLQEALSSVEAFEKHYLVSMARVLSHHRASALADFVLDMAFGIGRTGALLLARGVIWDNLFIYKDWVIVHLFLRAPETIIRHISWKYICGFGL